MANINVLGYPSSAGAYCVGVEHAPAALRDAGLIGALRAAGHQVDDLGDLAVHLWKPDRKRPLAQNLDEEVGALSALADAAAPLVAPDARLLVLGGSCTVALGLCAAVAGAGIEPHLVYVDRHLDLNTPDSTTQGSLSGWAWPTPWAYPARKSRWWGSPVRAPFCKRPTWPTSGSSSPPRPPIGNAIRWNASRSR